MQVRKEIINLSNDWSKNFFLLICSNYEMRSGIKDCYAAAAFTVFVVIVVIIGTGGYFA